MNTRERVGEYTRLWAEREFGPEHAAEVAEIVAAYTKYHGRRKPELSEPNTYSLVNYREAETDISEYQTLAREAAAGVSLDKAVQTAVSFGHRRLNGRQKGVGP